MIEAVIFDFDGLIRDIEHLNFILFKKFLECMVLNSH